MTAPEAARPDEPFWRGLDDSCIVLQQCDRCGYVRWPLAEICPECVSPDMHWQQVSGRGTIWSHVVYHRAFQPEMRDRVPYVVAMVRLLEGPMFVGQVVNPEAGCTIGGPVVFESMIIDGEVVPGWRISE
jgi:uncharacterized protein